MAPRRRIEEGTRVNLFLRTGNMVFLTRLSASIREATGAVIVPSGILRAVVDALQSADLDLSGVESEEQLAEVLAERLAAGGKSRSKARR